MVHHQRYHQLRKGGFEEEEEEEEEHVSLALLLDCKRNKPNLLRLLFVFSVISCSLVFASRLFGGSFLYFYNLGAEDLEDDHLFAGSEAHTFSPCSSVANGTICCERSGFRSDTCFMKGDIRTRSASSSVVLYSSNYTEEVEKIKPYTRKWETSVMDTINELQLIVKNSDSNLHSCQVQHSVPAIFFSTGGYTGNVYHEFNDGILPLYITSRNLNKQVVFVILEYHDWWITKYGDILSRLSDYPPVDFNQDKRTHCFPEAIVGLKIHDELSIDSSQMQGNESIWDFRKLLDEAYKPRIRSITQEEEAAALAKRKKEEAEPVAKARLPSTMSKPKLVIVSRNNGSRSITNERGLVELAEDIGFKVEVLRPKPSTELAKIYRSLNSCDAMIGVHGAAMTHFLFMRPGSVFVQVVPLGTDWAAQTYYGEPSMKLSLRYIGYKITPRESSLYKEYDKDDAVLRDPDSVNAKGWQVTKKVYLDGQKVTLDLWRFRKRLVHVYRYSISSRRWN